MSKVDFVGGLGPEIRQPIINFVNRNKVYEYVGMGFDKFYSNKRLGTVSRKPMYNQLS